MFSSGIIRSQHVCFDIIRSHVGFGIIRSQNLFKGVEEVLEVFHNFSKRKLFLENSTFLKLKQNNFFQNIQKTSETHFASKKISHSFVSI